ncbi:MAG: hypothetical protein WC438_00415 [Candidatus Pacearchaeota archaeon]
MKKRGQSQIITTILIILLVLVAIIVIWNVVSGVIKTSSDKITIAPFVNQAEIESLTLQNGGVTALVGVKRTGGDDELAGLKIIFEDGNKNIYIYENLTDYPKNLETKYYTIQNTDTKPEISNFSIVEKTSVVLLVMDSTKDKTNCTAEANVITCGTWVCGNKINNCGQSVSCGNCSGNCNNGNCELINIGYSNNITQYGITWHFDKQMEFGTYANGDYWVVGPVNITQIEPEPVCDISNGRHGTMINPRFNNQQGYDARAPGYNLTLCKVKASASPGDSVISTISLPNQIGFTFVKSASVLTIVDVPQSSDKFRPPYTRPTRIKESSQDNLVYSSNNINYELLPKLMPISATPLLSQTEKKFERVWIEHFEGWELGRIQPYDNMADYGRENSVDVSEASLQLLLNYSNQDKKKLLIGFMQYGIDLYGIYLDNGEWHPDGGIFMGRKWPLLFTGIMLNNSIKNIEMNPERFQEDGQTFYVSPPEIYSIPYYLNSNGLYSTLSEGKAKITNSSNVVEGINTLWKSSGIIEGDSIIGTDGKKYTCITKHISNESTRPISGNVWQNYWILNNNAQYVFSWANNSEYKIAFFGVENDSYEAYNPNGKAHVISKIIDDTHLLLEDNYRGNTDLSGNANFKIGNILVYYGHGNPSKVFDFTEYTNNNLGLPEWGLQHATQPGIDGLNWWDADYRTLNGASWPGTILAVLILDQNTSSRKLWDHNSLFDYQDRYMEVESIDFSIWDGVGKYNRALKNQFIEGMWDTYRKNYGCIWVRNNKTDIYSQGHYECENKNISCAWQAEMCVGCIQVSSCPSYPNQRAYDYDPCNLGCN